MAEAERLRLFFALWPSAEVRAQLAQLSQQLVGAADKPVPAENFHITLAFLGNVDAPFKACATQVAAGLRPSPFTLTLDRLGVFARHQILWLGCSQASTAAQALVNQLQTGLKLCGFAPEDRAYRVHITLARRFRYGRPRHAFEPIVWEAQRFALVQSRTLNSGAVYEPLEEWPLTG